MKWFPKFGLTENKRRIDIESSEKCRFFEDETDEICPAQSDEMLRLMQRIDLGKSVNYQGIVEPGNLRQFSSVVICLPYSAALLQLCARLYMDTNTALYLVKDDVDTLPWLEDLLSLHRVNAISHSEALNLSEGEEHERRVFLSIPEFHPKSLHSDMPLTIGGIQCRFSAFPLLLRAKRQMPMYYMDAQWQLNQFSQLKMMFEALSLFYSQEANKVYSWSRLNGHKVSHLQRRYISQVNQLEGVLRLARSENQLDTRGLIDTLKQKKDASLQGVSA